MDSWSWSRIVCYGLSNFEPNPQLARDRCERYCQRRNISIDKSALNKFIQGWHVHGAAQLEFLTRLQKVPTFIFDLQIRNDLICVLWV